MKKASLSKLILVCGVVLVQACAGYPTYDRGLRVKWADDAGSVSVSQSSVTEWDDVAADLQPNFKMDSATAFTNAIPITQSFDERLADIIGGSLQIGLPTTTSTNITREVTDAETGEPVTTVDNTRNRQVGSVPAANSLTPAGAAVLTALSSGSLGDDPILRYLAATSLQQEVALLNRYVRDRVRWPGSQAFVVRLQLSVMPNGRSMPYDVETDITLHAEDEQSRARLGVPSRAVPVTVPLSSTSEMIAAREQRCASGSYDSLQVLPMIVTDNLEGLRAARTTDNVRQLALALMGTAGNVGASGQFSRTMEALRRSEGRDTNSLFTIARLSDDTVRVRLGAVQSPRFGYVMIPRNHVISLVVVFRPCISSDGSTYEDDGPRVLTAVTRTTYRDVETGHPLQFQDATQRLYRQIGDIQRRFVGQFNYIELARMYQWVARQDRRSFFNYVVGQHVQANMCTSHNAGLGTLAGLFGISAQDFYGVSAQDYQGLSEPQDYIRGPDGQIVLSGNPVQQTGIAQALDERCLTLARMRYEIVATPLWTELVSIRPAGQFAYTNIPIALRRRSPTFPPNQVALINYSDAEGAVTLTQGQDLAGLQNVQMTLHGVSAGPVQATDTSILANGRTVTGKFPPLGRFNVQPTAPAGTYTLELRATGPNCPGGGSNCSITYPVVLNNTAAPTAGGRFNVDTTAAGIVANPATGQGRLIVSIVRRSSTDTTPFPTNMTIVVEGAQVTNIRTRAGVNLAAAAVGWTVAAPGGDVVLDLENLIPNTIVKVTVREGTTPPVSVSRSVVAGTLRSSD
ncbi:MAG TPA: hypothetical protein VIT38_11965 [Allosphingosinicella sp.]